MLPAVPGESTHAFDLARLVWFRELSDSTRPPNVFPLEMTTPLRFQHYA